MIMKSPTASLVAQRLLSDRTYDIEFNGYLSNHAKHAVVALQRLGAPPERLQEYWDAYAENTYGFHLHPVDQPWSQVKRATIQEYTEWRGQQVHWQEQVALLQQELDSEECGGDTDRLVQKFAPSLLDGIAGALTHGIIHLGWAIDAKSPEMILEGLAYLNYCHLGVDPAHFRYDENEAAGSGTTPIESFVRVAKVFEEQNLATTWVARVKSKYNDPKNFHPELVAAGFQWEVSKLAHEPHPDIVTTMPSWIDLKSESDEEEARVWDGLYRAVTYLYLASRDDSAAGGGGHGNFVVLHLITSLWALEQVCRVLKETNRDNDDPTTAYPTLRRRAWSQFYATAVVVLSAAGFIPSEALQRVQQEVGLVDTSDDFDWAPVVEAGKAEVEEHNIKLVYVARELWKRQRNHWKGYSVAAKAFTLTPNISGGAFNNNSQQ